MILSYSVCSVPVLPLRKEPNHRAEQVSQLVYGEKAEILEQVGEEWVRVRAEWDNYDGWCRLGQLSLVSKKEYAKEAKFLTASHSGRLILGEAEMWLPMGADIIRSKSVVGSAGAKFKGKKLEIKKLELTGAGVCAAALQYVHAPYLWGGKTVMGIDCSGLTQMAFRMCNMAIPRDASFQAMEGEIVDFLQNARPGDLAFFDNAEGKINHVGILLDNENIVHATDTSGRVVKDRIDQGGIISRRLKKRTHNLRVVKRYI